MKPSNVSRREFIAMAGMATAAVPLGVSSATAASSRRVSGANNKIRMGFIGIGNRGSQVMAQFMKQPEVEIAALCDVYEPYLVRDLTQVDPRFLKDREGQIPKMDEKFTPSVKRFHDFRKLLEQKDIDAVCIATPDHWHALMTIQAIQAGKDVYVEKPLTATIREGRMMVEAQAASKQVVIVGLNRRGCPVYQKLAKEIPAGKIGKVSVARAHHISNMFPAGIGKLRPEVPPKGLDWDMWLGPRAQRPYQYNIAPYMFRWWKDYSSQMGNWGVHYMDVIRWMMGEKAPVAISAHGGKFVIDDDRTIPDTMEVVFEFASGALVTFSCYEASSGNPFPYGEVELRGTKGTLYADEKGYQVNPAQKGQFQTWTKSMEAEQFKVSGAMLPDGSSSYSTAALVRSFLDCVKSRATPICPLEEGHRSTSFAHLANIALATRQRLEWDAEKERFTNSEAANALLQYEYRAPWKL